MADSLQQIAKRTACRKQCEQHVNHTDFVLGLLSLKSSGKSCPSNIQKKLNSFAILYNEEYNSVKLDVYYCPRKKNVTADLFCSPPPYLLYLEGTSVIEEQYYRLLSFG